MSTYQPKVYRAQGGAELVVASGGKVTIGPAAGPANAIADVTGGSTVDAESRTAINAVLAALRAAGLVAAS